MDERQKRVSIKYYYLMFALLLLPTQSKASFIESSMGAAVVNDAAAIYFNPAALVFLKTPQFISINSFGNTQGEFNGEFRRLSDGFMQQGQSKSQSRYHLPAFYLGIPLTKKITIGFGIISNFLNRDIEGDSVLRYVQSSNKVQGIDIIPAIEYKFNDTFSIGTALNLSYANFLLMPTTGFPSLNIPDSQSRNQAEGTGLGGDIGLLLRPNKATTIGFNYRSAITYHLDGSSIFEGNTRVISGHYGFDFWTPARSVLSINQMITETFGIIATAQRIQWSIFNEQRIHGIASQIGLQPIILDAKVPYHFQDTWLFTLGTHYRITPKWIIRIASTYNQSPGNSKVQISNGDSIIIGGSMGYDINNCISIDGSYAHAYIQENTIQINNIRNQINGTNKGAIDVVSLKLTFNL